MNIIENYKIQMKISNAQILQGLKLIDGLDEIFRVKWKPVPSFQNYRISNRGKVQNVTTGKILKPRACDCGVQLWIPASKTIKGRGVFKSIYKLVGEEFTHNDAVRAFVSIANPALSWDCVDITKSYGYINAYCSP